MKFLLITDYFDYAYGGVEPLGMLYILSAIRKAGHETKLIGDKYAMVKETVEKYRPDMIGYSIYTGYHCPQIELNRCLKKEHDFISIFGGPHPTFFPEMVEEPGVDIVCQGEGEEAIVELMGKIEKGEDYSSVRNFWIKKDGEIFRNPLRPLEQDLQKIDPPARDLLYEYPQIHRNRIRMMITARGCPYSCTYCYNYKIKELYTEAGGMNLRHRPVDDVIEEIVQVREKYPLEYVYFGTDNFTSSKRWALEFAEKYFSKINLPFLCSTRPETADLEVCKALKRANCAVIYMGIESGDESIRRELLNRKMSDKRIVEAAEAIHQAGLRLATFNMMLLPGETLKQGWKTVTTNIQCRADFCHVAVFQPYPKTKLAEYSMEKGYFDGNFDRIPKSWFRNSILRNPKRKQLERLQKLAGIAVEFPWMLSLINFAIKLPLSPLYSQLMKIHKAYCYRYRLMPLRLTFAQILRLCWKYLFDRSS